MKIFFTVLILSFSLNAYALTVEGLIGRYGKQAIMDVISNRIENKFTIYVSDGSQQYIAAPNPDLITPETLTIDIVRSGLSIKAVESTLYAQFSEAEQKKTEEKKLEQLKIIQEQKRIRIKEALKALEANREVYKVRDQIAESEKRELQRRIDEKRQTEINEKYGSQSINYTASTLKDNPRLSTTDKLDSWRNASALERVQLSNIIVDKIDKPNLKSKELNDCISDAAGDGGLDSLPTLSIAAACITLQNR